MYNLIAIYGGTFNPIHKGHVETIIDLNEKIHFNEVLFMPNAIQPHRDQTQVSAKDRLHMIRLALDGYENFKASDYEIRQAELNRQISYTIHTVSYFSALLKEYEKLVFILGFDAYLNFTKWHQWQRILELTSLIVLKRNSLTKSANESTNNDILESKHIDISTLKNTSAKGIYFANNDKVDISSTDIRQQIKEENFSCLSNKLHYDVLSFIQQKHLYK